MKKLNQKGFGAVEIVALIVFLSIFVGIGGFVWHKNQTAAKPKVVASSNTDIKKAVCSDKGGMQICVTRQTEKLAYTDSTILSVKITNKSGNKYETAYNCDYTGPTLVINGKGKKAQLCDDTVTDLVLKDGESKRYTLKLNGSDLSEGENFVKVHWADFESQDIYFEQPIANAKDTAKLEDCFTTENKPYCADIAVIIKEGYYSDDTTCDDLIKYFSKFDLNPEKSFCDLASGGEILFSVPKTQADAWKMKLTDIPEVEQVTIM